MAIASALEERGLQVEYLGIVDSRPVSATVATAGVAESLEQALAATLMALREAPFQADEISAIRQSMSNEGVELGQLLNPRHAEVGARLFSRWTGVAITPQLMQTLLEQVQLTKHHMVLAARFRPRRLAAPMHLVMASESPPFTADDRSYFLGGPKDPETTRTILEETIDGDHYGVLREPGVLRLAERVRHVLAHGGKTHFSTARTLESLV
jgi:thioesterase domain-containing protein